MRLERNFAVQAVGSVIMERREGRPPILIAGVRASQGIIHGFRDGDGRRAEFGMPAAVALSNDGTAYVADFEGSVIRRLRLPAWLTAGEDPPERILRDMGRGFRGRRD